MNTESFFPVFMLEVETGDVELINHLDHLCSLVEEFWDILEEDFKFWDKEGYVIKFNEAILEKDFHGIIRSNIKEYDKLKLFLYEYARMKSSNLSNTDEDDLVRLYTMIRK